MSARRGGGKGRGRGRRSKRGGNGRENQKGGADAVVPHDDGLESTVVGGEAGSPEVDEEGGIEKDDASRASSSSASSSDELLQEAMDLLQYLARPDVVRSVARADTGPAREIKGALRTLIAVWKDVASPMEADNGPATEESESAGVTQSNASADSASKNIRDWGGDQKAYDEVYDDDGNVRPAYAGVMPVIERIEKEAPERIDAFVQQSNKAFQKDNSLYHLPRMLTIAEHERIHSGVMQRARAFRAFFLDHYQSEKSSYAQNNVIPRLLVQQMMVRSGEQKMSSLMSTVLDKWGFWYGPDILRGPDGAFYVCEDNLGYVGGMGDLVCARRTLFSKFPELQPELGGVEPEQFYSDICSDYFSAVEPGEKVVLLHYPAAMTADNEEKRVVKLFANYGVESVVLPVPEYGRRKNRKQPRKERPFLRTRADKRIELVKPQKKGDAVIEMVGLVIIDAESFDVDPRNSSVKRKLVADEAQYWLEYYEEQIKKQSKKQSNKRKQRPSRKLQQLQSEYDELKALLSGAKKRPGQIAKFLRRYHKRAFKDLLAQGVEGLLDSFYSGNVKIINGPGFDFMGDKLFCSFADDIIRFYLSEEPILRTIPTRSFCMQPTKQQRKELRAESDGKFGKLLPDMDVIAEVFDDPAAQQSVVVKRVDGRGGDGVWVGPKIPRSEFLPVRELVMESPDAFIVQKYLELSQVDGHLVDIRCLCNVMPSRISVSKTFWGRGVPVDGNGKVNISDRGFEFAIGVHSQGE